VSREALKTILGIIACTGISIFAMWLAVWASPKPTNRRRRYR
jgi:hypothetical protein